MKYYPLIIVISLLLVSCANRQQVAADAAVQCPQIGIDVMAPDFYRKQNRKAVEDFYACMEAKTAPGAMPVIGKAGSPIQMLLNGTDQEKTALKQRLEYQKILWRQVLNKEKTASAAQEAWFLWSSDMDTKGAAIDAPAPRPVMTNCVANGSFLNCNSY